MGDEGCMRMEHLPFDSSLDTYAAQAEELLAAWNADDTDAIHLFHENHPRFLDEEIRWLPNRLTVAELRREPLDLSDARLALARYYSFADWTELAEYAAEVTREDSRIYPFEAAVEALITGNAPALDHLLRGRPEVVRARSSRVTPHDPPRHQATLLHYVAANGVENYRQKTPKNAVALARSILETGADPDATAGMYGGQCSTMSMLVSSCHPAQAGVQVPLVHLLLDYGANVDGKGTGRWTSPLITALTFGYRDAAEALMTRGAQIRTFAAAAGLGRLDDAARLLPAADYEDRHRGLVLAAINGHVATVKLLLDHGEDPNRYNPEGLHSHSTPLHQAVRAGHFDVVELLVERGARPEIKDTLWNGTSLGWAEHCQRPAIAEYLRTLASLP
jgi:ankyrin repeat protein